MEWSAPLLQAARSGHTFRHQPRLSEPGRGLTLTKASKELNITSVGIDLAKRSFQLYAVDDASRPMLSKKLMRTRLLDIVARLPVSTITMEACGSAHHWGRASGSMITQSDWLPPQFVKPYVKANKNDAADAEMICEAVQRPTMRFVSIKSVLQQDMQAIHRIRSLVVRQRTALDNQIRGLLLEYGIEIA